MLTSSRVYEIGSIFYRILLKRPVLFLQSWTSTGSSVTDCWFSPIIGLGWTNLYTGSLETRVQTSNKKQVYGSARLNLRNITRWVGWMVKWIHGLWPPSPTWHLQNSKAPFSNSRITFFPDPDIKSWLEGTMYIHSLESGLVQEDQLLWSSSQTTKPAAQASRLWWAAAQPFAVELKAGGGIRNRVQEPFELNQLKSAPSQLLPDFSGFDRLQTCCHSYGPVNIFFNFISSAG